MAKKTRFRDIKQGKNTTANENNKSTKIDLTKYAPISSKIKAFITDLFMLLMPILYVVIYFIMGGRDEFFQSMIEGWFYILIPNFIMVFLFFWKSGQTPGCRAYAIELVDSKTKEKAHPVAIALRYYFELLSIFSIVGLLMAFFRKDRKSLHDLLSGTMLVTTTQKPTLDNGRK